MPAMARRPFSSSLLQQHHLSPARLRAEASSSAPRRFLSTHTRRLAAHNNNEVSPAGKAWSHPPSPASSKITDEQIAHLAAQPIRPLTLSDLVKSGRPPLSTEALLASAQHTSRLIPIRLAHRVRALRSLPFIVVSNPHVSRIYATYLRSLETLISYHGRSFADPELEREFTDALADLVQSHANTIPLLARGFLECRRYVSPDAVTRFLDEHLRARIGTRLIAEQHIALHLASRDHHQNGTLASSSSSSSLSLPSSYIGVIDTALKPAAVLSSCEDFVAELCELKYGVRPSIVLSGGRGQGQGRTAAADLTIAHIPTHVEYILTEILKNAFRATVENGREREPIEVTIVKSDNSDDGVDHDHNGDGDAIPEDDRLESENHRFGLAGGRVHVTGGTRTTASACNSITGGGACGPGDETLTLRVRDRGGGIAPHHLPHIWGYSFTTFQHHHHRDHREPSPGSSSAPSYGMSAHYGDSSSLSTIDALDAIAASGGNTSTIAGLGYGLPLSRAYAEYFGGSIELQSLWGWGTDVYLRLRGLKGF